MCATPKTCSPSRTAGPRRTTSAGSPAAPLAFLSTGAAAAASSCKEVGGNAKGMIRGDAAARRRAVKARARNAGAAKRLPET